jgi:hypothetical protein
MTQLCFVSATLQVHVGERTSMSLPTLDVYGVATAWSIFDSDVHVNKCQRKGDEETPMETKYA